MPTAVQPAAPFARPLVSGDPASGQGPRAAILASASMLAICVAAPLAAQVCTTSGNTETCTYTDDNYSGLTIYKDGGQTENQVIDSQGQLVGYTDLEYGPFGISVGVNGVKGSGSAPDGSAGVDVTLTNSGLITLSYGGTGTNQPTVINGILGSSIGADGIEPSSNGDGGRGGDGGVISITNNGTITYEYAATQAFSASVYGIRAESQGGAGGDMNSGAGDQKGGNSGDGKNITISNTASITMGTSGSDTHAGTTARGISAISHGNSGGSENGAGGTGGYVTITNSGAISAYIDFVGTGQYGFHGIYGRSNGTSGAASNDNSDNGGKGEDGRPVSITNSGNITLSYTGSAPQNSSAGIFAHSAGGTGGTSANSSTGGAGGSGSADDNGNPATTTVSLIGGTISTSGDYLSGVIVRSEGGQGGDGNGNDDSTGGAGGDGGAVGVTMSGSAAITTDGDEGYGVLAQSIGALGGGDAGTAGAGGPGGTVSIETGANNTIRTEGEYAVGLTAHSIGGFGGTGEDFTGVLAGSGGTGGKGGDAQLATIHNNAAITTSGAHAYGALAQSIGGSGGHGGITDTLVVALGGGGGAGGDANSAMIMNTGAITTSGSYAVGLMVQSLSGGGGAAGTAGGIIGIGGSAGTGANNTYRSYVTNSGDITTSGASAIGIVLQSIGGGGGTGGGEKGVIGVGGTGSTGGDGGQTSLFSVGGTITTSGDHAYGIVSQSVGGGGGNGGDANDISLGIGIGVGGSGSGGGNGAAACAANFYDACPSSDLSDDDKAPQQSQSAVQTSGDFAHGIIVQSTGGGGGNGGDFFGDAGFSLAAVQIGGSGGTAAAGGTATAKFDALDLTTSGDNAKGMIVQSTGGGGGNGGNSTAFDGVNPVGIQVGGGAGGGGNAGATDVSLSGSTLTTTGANAGAILAQSQGGGGGTGGAGYGADVSLAFSFDAAIGGSGGGGGNAGGVTVDLDSSCILTGLSGGACNGTDATGTALGPDAASSHAISMQANGGGGGTGGTSMAAALAASIPTGEGESVSVAGTLSVGGTGGGGGNGGAASVTMTGGTHIATGGDGSYGILAQSTGGGGGDGGAAGALSGSLGFPNSISVDLSMSLGGAGGSGGHGSTVDAEMQGSTSIATHGDIANGIVLQSVGGGGGDGNVGNASNDRIGRGMNISTHIGLGGRGGSGGTGGSVTFDQLSNTSIATTGTGSHGLVAQSIGGGGGTGQGGSIGVTAQGFSLGEALEIKNKNGTPPTKVLKFSLKGSMEVNVGGTAGTGNSGGALDITTGGAITTQGDDADAVVVQSIGGGGGIGGTAGSSSSSNDSMGQLPRPELAVSTTAGATLSFGGSGGSGGDGGAVTYAHSGTATTQGDYADAIVVQSIGGGGGAGGLATNGDGDQEITVDMAMGGKGGAAGDGGDISVSFDSTNGGAVATTQGSYAHAILLHSIGAGGGHGASGNEAGAGTTNVDIGGGSVHSLKLNAGISLGAGIGGNGGASGNGGNVTVSSTGTVTARTTGTDAHAFMAQSIGAGGGNADVGGTSESNGPLDIDLSVTLGGDGGAGGHGGTIDIDTDATISTQGHRAIGMLLQSIGGGGGTGGIANSENVGDVSLQSVDGSSGSGGAVTLNLGSGQITTHGVGGHAIVAQSIGGGGGIAGDIAASTLQTNAPTPSTDKSEGNGTTVDLTVNADITTSNSSAYGIIAQSIGGRGGLWGSDGTLYAGSYGGAEGNGGTVSVNQSGTLTTSGEGSIGIFGQSVGVASNEKVTITVNGAVTGGSGEGSAIYVSEGNANALNINSSGYVIAGNVDDDDTAGYAIRYLGSYDQDYGFTLAIANFGYLDGKVSLIAADNDDEYTFIPSGSAAATAATGPQIGGTLTNGAGATWRMQGASMANVVNSGTVSTLGTAVGRQVQLTGDFTQTGEGLLELAADFGAGTADHIHFDGDVTLAGKLRIAATGVAPGRAQSVLGFGGAVTGMLEAEDSAAVDYRLDMGATGATVSIAGTSFGTAFDGFDANQAEVGRHLDAIFDAGAQGYAGVLADFDALSRQEDGGAAYAAALGAFTPGSALAAAATQAMFARARMDSALRCRATGSILPDASDSCAWADIAGQNFDQNGVGGYEGNLFTVSGGARSLLDSGWELGFALGYEHSSFTADGGASSADGDGGYAAVAIGREIGGFELGLAVSGSYGSYDLERRVSGAAPGTQAEGDTDVSSLGARLHGSRVFGGAAGYVRPALDLDLVHTRADGYTETGAGAYNLAVEAQSETILIATPSVEVGRQMTVGNGMTLSMFAGAALSLSNADEWTSVARLALADPAAGSFTTSVPVADQLGRLSVGLSLARSERFEARVEYSGSFGSDFTSHGLGLGLTARF